MCDAVTENMERLEGQYGQVTETAGAREREGEGKPEMETCGTYNTEVHQLLEQVARLLSGKKRNASRS